MDRKSRFVNRSLPADDPCAAFAAAALLLTACGDDESTGPEFGDLEFAPNQLPSIAAGRSAEVSASFSFAGLTEELCPLATYEVDINAALGTTLLGSSQIRLDHTELE